VLSVAGKAVVIGSSRTQDAIRVLSLIIIFIL